MPPARRASRAETRQRSGESNFGLYAGRYYHEETGRADADKIVYQGDRHALLFGPTGTGKTKRFLMVNLLSDCLNGRSVVVIDPKGELAAVTALHRSRLPGHKVQILDPFGKLHDAVKDSLAHRELVAGGLTGSAGFNPFDALDPGTENNPNPNFYDDAAAIGEALIKIEGTEPHWTESAQGLVIALVMWEKLRNGATANLGNVRELLTEADEFEIGKDGKPKQARGLCLTAAKMVARGGYEIASLAGRFMMATDEIASIRSNGDTQTRWILSRRMRTDLKKAPGIDFAQLKETPTTVYVILPAERMRTHSVWLRLVVVSVLRALYRPSGLRTMLLIDEMAALGQLGPLEDAFGLVRGYGVQIAGIFQDMSQIKALYKERWESFVANAGVVQFFAPNDKTTAEWMSWRSGQTTTVVKGESQNTGSSPSGDSSGRGATWSQMARNYDLPHELMGMAEGTGLLWFAGMSDSNPFFAPFYKDIDQCARRASHNPYDD